MLNNDIRDHAKINWITGSSSISKDSYNTLSKDKPAVVGKMVLEKGYGAEFQVSSDNKIDIVTPAGIIEPLVDLNHQSITGEQFIKMVSQEADSWNITTNQKRIKELRVEELKVSQDSLRHLKENSDNQRLRPQNMVNSDIKTKKVTQKKSMQHDVIDFDL